MLKELRKIINRNAHYCNKELETIKRSQLEGSFAKTKVKLKAIYNKLNNAEE